MEKFREGSRYDMFFKEKNAKKYLSAEIHLHKKVEEI